MLSRHYVHSSVVTTYLQLQQMDSFKQNRKASYRKQIARQQSRHKKFLAKAGGVVDSVKIFL